MREILLIFIIVFSIGILSACTNVKTKNNDNNNTKVITEKVDTTKTSVVLIKQELVTDTINPLVIDSADLIGYDELANEGNYESFTVSAYNTDLDNIPNIKKPLKSTIKNFKFPKKNFYGIWVRDTSPETPHATFQITKESFLMVDYDGDEDMPYEINNDSIIVYFNDFVKRGRVIDATTTDSIVIYWNNSKKPTTYYKWIY